MKKVKGKKFSEVCAKSRNKKDCNAEYRNLVRKFGCCNGKHLVLDSKFKNTIKTLNYAKIPTKNIYVPNPYEKINTPNWIDKSVGDFLLDNCYAGIPRLVFSSVYLDYCCSLRGNEDTSPIDDIKTLINNKMIDGILGVEISARDPEKNKKIGRRRENIRSWEDIGKLIFEIENLAIENDYIYQVINIWTYKQMAVIWVYLKK